MAEGEATLIIRLKDLATSGLDKLSGAFSGIGAKVAALGLTFGGLKVFVLDSIKAFAEQEAAIIKLTNALKNQGITSQAAIKDLSDFAGQLQKTTRFSDETIIEMQTLLVTFGMTTDEIKRSTIAAADLASGLGVDLRTATLLVGKAFSGETSTLARYGLKIDEGLSSSQKFAAVLGQIQSRFGGAAQADAETFSGKVAQLNNSFSELKERIGKIALPWLIDRMKDLNVILDFAVEKWNELFPSDPLQRAQRELEVIRGQIEAMRATPVGAMEPGAGIGGLGALDPLFESEKAKLLEIDNLKKKYEQDELLRKKELAAKLTAQNQAKVNLTQKQEEQLAVRQVGLWSDTFGVLSSLQGAKTKEAFLLGKAASVAQTTIAAWRAYIMGLANPPGPPFSIPQAKAALGIGLASAAVQAGISFAGLAEGGVVLPRFGGVPAIIGEGGRSEAVIPLGDERAKEQIRETVGTGVTIQINAGLIVADEMSVDQFARKIDEHLFALKRNKESVAFT